MRAGLIASERACHKCDNVMFFARSTVPISKLLKALYFWASETHVMEAGQHAKVTAKTAGKWYAYTRVLNGRTKVTLYTLENNMFHACMRYTHQ
ncbi:hypothetical protein PHYSODRAFT_326268 [Phytophthora sojae]|uniref:Uncharacterized protein n=1 Tax=Phytophthora sojae (strain P6497) TaxID=1094619 RepID=G4YZK6_PHYSP|nr:hypothetical protein PHYSODRAFT_326268 [Phytophthora sojae]EGZ25212.1 hypothetical protein PHYSODRAFT_326268 [Phytophthora sojae]|eukprot:XP_009520500.1 hypothetical protein PHYSODRAFT_326268 [Phytophthora sojae]